jgi:hypothetical protein
VRTRSRATTHGDALEFGPRFRRYDSPKEIEGELVKDIEGAFRAACALQRDGYTYCATKAYIKVKFRLDDDAARKVLARVASGPVEKQRSPASA